MSDKDKYSRFCCFHTWCTLEVLVCVVDVRILRSGPFVRCPYCASVRNSEWTLVIVEVIECKKVDTLDWLIDSLVHILIMSFQVILNKWSFFDSGVLLRFQGWRWVGTARVCTGRCSCSCEEITCLEYRQVAISRKRFPKLLGLA